MSKTKFRMLLRIAHTYRNILYDTTVMNLLGSIQSMYRPLNLCKTVYTQTSDWSQFSKVEGLLTEEA